MLYLLLLTAYLIIFTLLSWKKPQWAIFIILAALPSYAVRFSLAGIPMTLLEGMILLLFTSWIVKKVYFFYCVRSVNYNFKSKVKSQKSKIISNFQFLSRIKYGANKISQFLNFLISNQKIILPIFLFLLSATISVFSSPDKRAALGIWKAYFIEPILFLIVFVDIFRGSLQSVMPTDPDCCGEIERDPSTSLRSARDDNFFYPFHFTASALSIPALYISLFAIYQKFTGFLVPAEYWQPGYHRVTSFFSYPNAIGLLLAPIVIILLGAALVTPFSAPAVETRLIASLRRWVYLITAILALLAIIFAKSEGAIIALIAGGFIFLFCCRDGACSVSTVGRKLKIAALSLLILAASSSAAIYLNCGKQWNELFNNTNIFELDSACSKIVGDSSNCRLPACSIYQKLTLQDYSGTLRRNMWKETFEMLKDCPLLGAGLAGYQQIVAQYHKMDFVEVYLYPHNIFLNFWSETGLLGLIAFLWLIIIFFITAFRRLHCFCLEERKAKLWSQNTSPVYAAALLASMSVLLIHGIVDVPYFKNDLAILFWVIFGMMSLIVQE